MQAVKKTMASGSGDSRSSRSESFIRGYHVYQWIGNPEHGEVAVTVLEDDNTHDRYTVATVRDLRIGSHCFSLNRAIFDTF